MGPSKPGKSYDSYAAISQTAWVLGSDLRGAGFGFLNLNLDLETGKSLGCLYWGILGAVNQMNQFWSEVALKAVSEELHELRRVIRIRAQATWKTTQLVHKGIRPFLRVRKLRSPFPGFLLIMLNPITIRNDSTASPPFLASDALTEAVRV